MSNYTLKVVDIRKETDDTITLCFKQPALRKIKYLAGQYISLIFRINNRRYIRPYSFSSSPLADLTLEVTVKKILNGIVSNHIHDLVRIGDMIEVLPPMGDFVYKSHSKNHFFLWGAGSGITPLISIAKEALLESIDNNVHLVYGNKSYESTIFLDQIRLLQERYKKRFTITFFHTKNIIDVNIPNVIQGRIDQNKAIAILKKYNKVDAYHYICGPNGLKESVKQALQKSNISMNNIFSEDFELVKDPRDFENIYTQIIELNFNGSPYNLEIAKGSSILEAALDSNIELPYSCQTGNCSTCKGRLKSGKLKMVGPTKDRDDLEKDEYLLCCSYPLSEDVCVEV